MHEALFVTEAGNKVKQNAIQITDLLDGPNVTSNIEQ